uniref:Uncharacterized protein n=1 Tax=Panagrolaimus sp. PS1159 TaxID=55785 RepID=A0AC35GEV6_9BILA
MRTPFNYGNKSFTKTLIIIVIITTLTDLLPNIITGLGTLIFHTYLANFIGPYNITVYGITMAICSRMYSKALLNNTNISQIHVSMQHFPVPIRSI